MTSSRKPITNKTIPVRKKITVEFTAVVPGEVRK
jgi:hypothetical protein